MLVMLLCGLPAEKIKSHEFVKADWLGIAGLALGLSTLIAILEEGQRENWFESTMICRLSVISVTGLLMIIMSQIYVEKPVLNLRLFRNKSFSSVIIIIFVTGIVLYGIAYLVPQFLSHIAGYNAEQSGGVLLLAGIPALLLMYILPRLVTKVDIRLIVIPGLVLFAISCFMDTSLSIQSSGDSFVISQLVRGTAQMLCMMPLNQAAMAAVTKEESGDAAGLYNMARNLGGAIGLALIGTFLDRREAFHNTVLRESVHASSPVAQSKFEALAGSSVGGDSHIISAAQLVKMIAQQSSVLAYNETYLVLMVSILLCIPMAFLLKRPQKK